ncbi:hypothetical protein SGM_1080 [Streptomyces griseoaurantiacus M045]|uniref:Uncharacterized protein n=1 Tax=Streptomyces griseoaurantiacus M045 TaxID=996637 RepID=F3ND66_9ACTN|nr:hypothetical protein SGM_1080 [Streptomyces griseoaurantiacus M045]
MCKGPASARASGLVRRTFPSLPRVRAGRPFVPSRARPGGWPPGARSGAAPGVPGPCAPHRRGPALRTPVRTPSHRAIRPRERPRVH